MDEENFDAKDIERTLILICATCVMMVTVSGVQLFAMNAPFQKLFCRLWTAFDIELSGIYWQIQILDVILTQGQVWVFN